MSPSDRVIRLVAALLLVGGLAAAGLAILADELGLGTSPGLFGWRRMTLLAVGAGATALGSLLLAERSGLRREPLALRPVLVSLALAVGAAIFIAHYYFDLAFEVVGITAGSATALLGLLVVVLVLPPRRIPLGLPAAVGAWFLTLSLVVANPGPITPDPPVWKAVGNAAYLAAPFAGRQVGLVVAIGAGLLLVGALVVLQRRRGHPPAQPRPGAAAQTMHHTRGGRGSLVAVLAGGGIAAILLVPDLDQAFSPISPEYSWDAGNFWLWEYFTWHGLVAMADYFYPYGSQWLYSLVPWGPVIDWLAACATIALAAWSLWHLSGKRGFAVALCLLALPLIAVWWGYFLWRYLPALLVALCYAALGPARHARPTRAHLVFFAACAFATFREGDLLLYGLAGCGLVLLGDLLSGVLSWRPLAIARGLLFDAITVALAVGSVVVIWALMGSAEGNLRFFTGLDAVSAASATPGTPISFSPSASAIYLALPGLLIAAGLAHLLLARRPDRAVSSLLLAAAGVALLWALRYLVRETPELAVMIPIVATLWATILLINLRTPLVAGAAGAFLAALALTLELERPNILGDYASSFAKSPLRLVDLPSLPGRADEYDRRREQQFSPETYPEFGEIWIAAEFMDVVDARDLDDAPEFAVLGDAQLLYMFFDQDPPFHVQLYDTSPTAEQRAMRDELESERPPYLIWRRDARIDEVPYQVRNPLIFTWAVENYVPVDRAQAAPEAPMHVLRRRRPNEEIAGRYWHQALGVTELESIPSYSRLAEAPRCAEGPECAPVAVVSEGDTATWKALRLRVGDGERSFTVHLATREGVESYAIRLDRLWFWPLIRGGAQVEALTPGWSADLVGAESEDLY